VNPYLSHNGEERPRHTLLVGKRTLCDEKRATRKHEVCPKYDNYRTGKSVRPIGLAVPDEREEYVPKCCEKRADACVDGSSRAERRMATSNRLLTD